MTAYQQVEKLIDRHGLADTLLIISDITSEKADHVVASYNDLPLADKWVRAGNVIRKAVRELPKCPGIK